MYWTLRAEAVPKDQAELAETDMLINVCHYQLDQAGHVRLTWMLTVVKAVEAAMYLQRLDMPAVFKCTCTLCLCARLGHQCLPLPNTAGWLCAHAVCLG